MNEILSQIVADLFDKSKGELSPKITYLRAEIKKVIESEGTVFGKFRDLVESFREVIPDEKQRYNAAIKALSTTSKLSKPEIVTAVNNQLEELKILEKSLVSTIPGWRNGLKVMEAKAQEMRNEIAKLRERIAWLENEEKGTLNGIVTYQMEAELAEKAMRGLFADIGAEITYIKNKVEEFTAESAAPQPPVPQQVPVITDIPIEKKEVVEQQVEISEPSAPQEQDTEWQKKCPMCGGRMNFHGNEQMWQCYSCAYEEVDKEKSGGGQKSESVKPSAPQKQDTELQKKCPMCGGRMDFLSNEQMWQCYSCGHEESTIDEVQGKPAPASGPGSGPTSPFTVPLADLPSNEDQAPKKGAAPPVKKKTCPACHKKMNWYPDDNAWRCPHCEYERRI